MLEKLKSFGWRAACFAASFVASASVLVAVGGAFHSASGQRWLSDSAHARDVAVRCAGLAEREARHRCVQAAVHAARARDLANAQLAAYEPGVVRSAAQ
jgi:hypothetical protein